MSDGLTSVSLSYTEVLAIIESHLNQRLLRVPHVVTAISASRNRRCAGTSSSAASSTIVSRSNLKISHKPPTRCAISMALCYTAISRLTSFQRQTRGARS